MGNIIKIFEKRNQTSKQIICVILYLILKNDVLEKRQTCLSRLSGLPEYKLKLKKNPCFFKVLFGPFELIIKVSQIIAVNTVLKLRTARLAMNDSKKTSEVWKNV
jgi:hypothetical protein